MKAIIFANGQAMVADCSAELQKMMDAPLKTSEEYDMRINLKKAKVTRWSTQKEK